MSKAKRKKEQAENQQGFASHLLALRSMMLRMALMVFAAFLLVFMCLTARWWISSCSRLLPAAFR